MSTRIPSTWEEYEQGNFPERRRSMSSVGNQSIQFEEQPLLSRDYAYQNGEGSPTRRRRSSVTDRLAAFTDIGGVNSIRSFTKSWQRAAGFTEVVPQRHSLVFAPDQVPIGGPVGDMDFERVDLETGTTLQARSGTSLLRQYLEASQTGGSAVEEDIFEPSTGHLLPRSSSDEREAESGTGARPLRTFRSPSPAGTASIFGTPPHLATPITGSYGSYPTYGTIYSDTGRPSMEHLAAAWHQQQESGGDMPDSEDQPILVKEVEQNGKFVLTVEGQSTLPQTIFNSINVLIGVGLLSLPLGIKYAGWFCGMIILFLCAAVTSYTAGLLAKCMNLDPSLITFSDIAYISFGRNARLATSVLFTLELVGACVALMVLFADSLVLLFPGALTVTQWKLVCSLFMIPLNFLPLRFLSFTSIIGIVSCISIVIILLVDGFIKPFSPGSLIEPAKTYLFPENWLTLPLSLGLLMSPWGGHSVFPNARKIYRDMRHPYKFKKAVKITFSFTYLLDTTTAVAGLLMFGDEVRDEITSNILETTGYPRILKFLICALIAIIPLTKVPLNARPVISTADVLFGLNRVQPPKHSDQFSLKDADSSRRSRYLRIGLKVTIRVATVLCFLAISILFPAFDAIMAFMGSALCFTICVTLPVMFYIKLFGHQISTKVRVLNLLLVALCVCLSVVGTVWAFLPKRLIGV